MNRGFSLLELMLALLLLVVLSGLAYRGYQHYSVRAQCQAALLSLHDWASQLQRYYSRHHGYRGVTLVAPDSSAYQFSWEINDDHTFSVTATPREGTLQARLACGRLTLNEQGHVECH